MLQKISCLLKKHFVEVLFFLLTDWLTQDMPRRGRGSSKARGKNKVDNSNQKQKQVVSKNKSTHNWFKDQFGCTTVEKNATPAYEAITQDDSCKDNHVGRVEVSDDIISNSLSVPPLQTSTSLSQVSVSNSTKSVPQTNKIANDVANADLEKDGEVSDTSINTDDGTEEVAILDPVFDKIYFTAKFFEWELQETPLEKWSTEQCAKFVHDLYRFEPKFQGLFDKVGQVISANCINGAMLCAIDNEYLVDEVLASGSLSKRDRTKRIIVAVKKIFDHLETRKEGSKFTNYFEKMMACNDNGSSQLIQE